MTKQINLPVAIIGCPTVRESNGLAMSSRNALLSVEQRIEAAKISRALFYVRDNWITSSPDELFQHAIAGIEKNGIMKVEYISIADAQTLEPVINRNGTNSIRVFAAVRLGSVRLIDNVEILNNNA